MRVFIILVLIVSCYVSHAQQVQVKSGWNTSVSSSEIIEAGLDYSGTITSDPDQTTINFNGGKMPESYYITVQKNDNGLDGLSLWVRRTGDGNGSPFATVSGGTTFMQVTDSGEILYSGINNKGGGTRRHVPIQYQFRGISVLLPVKTYSINVIYTISE
ncbi:hypothetical protein [Arcticibacterium luteifluviistationis]|uniref:Uncharacterized protein n=1 Tax=Arcticibacterium luteifluviistationis TaxID=1784714 RepID=A0A2Z4GCR0_9BACT|nr:hypothetical protein [Arcticibacterium luteifluviistationis]AWV98880.1 hypothetical protein DJ013_12135 [Arcticibacterium luteifluviistationis]